jgi:hypothetical protein
MRDAEAEYAAAKCAYNAALARLRLAKAALPPQTPSAAFAAKVAATRRRNEAICSRYRNGTTARELASEYKLSVEWIRSIVYQLEWEQRVDARLASKTSAVSALR